jgi:hypothetical protein
MRYRSVFLSLLAALVLTGGSLAGAVAQDATPDSTGGVPDAMLTDTFGLPELQIGFDGSTFTGLPAETPAGWTVVTFTNTSTEFGAVGFIQLPEGVTIESLFPPMGMDEGAMDSASPDAGMDESDMGEMASPEAGGEDPFAWLYQTYIAGGVGAAPGQIVQGIVDLRAGSYAVWADDPTAPVTPVALTVTGDATMASPAASGITADLTLTEVDTEQGFDFQVSGAPATGPVLVEVRNDSSQPHFATTVFSPNPISEDQVSQLLMLEEGTPVPAGLPNPEELVDAGFYASVQSSDTVQYVAANLDAGYYVLLCFVPDPTAGGVPHAFEGMVEIIEVVA